MSSNQGLYDPPVDNSGNARTQNLQEMEHELDTELRQEEKRPLTLQKEINGVVDTMRKNIQATSERGERLDTLQNKTDHLSDQANGFRRGANRVRKQMWWKDMKMRICIIVGIIILLLVIIIPSVMAARRN